MKRINFLFCLLSLSVLLLTSAKCRKDKNNNPVNQLPAETQSGENTFGCLVNGVAFKPQGSSLSGPNLTGIYQYIENTDPYGFVFAVSGTNKKDPCNITSIGFRIDSIPVTIGIHPLVLRKNGRGGAQYLKDRCGSEYSLYYTSDTVIGSLIITKFDQINQIASKTFWFNALNDKGGDTVKISDGRFDVRYTR